MATKNEVRDLRDTILEHIKILAGMPHYSNEGDVMAEVGYALKRIEMEAGEMGRDLSRVPKNSNQPKQEASV